MRRIVRLYPPYLVALLVYTALDKAHRHLDSWFAFDLGVHLIMVHNMTAATVYSLNGVFWTSSLPRPWPWDGSTSCWSNAGSYTGRRKRHGHCLRPPWCKRCQPC